MSPSFQVQLHRCAGPGEMNKKDSHCHCIERISAEACTSLEEARGQLEDGSEAECSKEMSFKLSEL